MALSSLSSGLGTALVGLDSQGRFAAAHVLVDSTGVLIGTGANPLAVTVTNASGASSTTTVSNFPATQEVTGTLSFAVGSSVIISSLPAVSLASGSQVAITASALPLPAGAATQATLASVQTTLAALLAAEQPYLGVVPMTVGTAYAAQRAIRINCTTSGNVSLTYVDGSVDVIPVAAGLNYIAGAITTVNSSGTTATATYANMK